MFNFWRIVRRGSAGLLLSFSGISSAQPLGPVGSTAGQFSTQSGAATYTIPLTLPPGLGEMKPELSLAYSSTGGDGIMGPGWSVSGLSAISLCPKTIAQDGAYIPVHKNNAPANQAFCLDGQRLKLVAGSAGSSGAEYRTEIESFSRIRVASWTGDVPTGFVVETKAGQTIEYGLTPDSRSHSDDSGTNTAIAWFANKITDASDNFILFEYDRPIPTAGSSAETQIKTISYTHNPHAGGGAHAKVIFHYIDRTAPRTYVAAGHRFERKRILSFIETQVLETQVRAYKMQYGTHVRTGGQVLKGIEECAGPSGSEQCLSPTQFEWNQNHIAMMAAEEAVEGDWGGDEWVRTGDFNGDGLTDIASPANGSVHMKLGHPMGGFTSETWSSNSIWPAAEHLMVADIDGDARSDFIFRYSNGLYVKLSRNGSFASTWYSNLPVEAGSTMAWGPAAKTFALDVDADGRTDVVTFPDAGNSNKPRVIRNMGNSFLVSEWTLQSAAAQVSLSNLFSSDASGNYVADITGDGIQDFVTTNGTLHFIATDPFAKRFLVERYHVAVGTDERTHSVGDFNGDGVSEFGILRTAGPPQIGVFSPTALALPVPYYAIDLPEAVPTGQYDWLWFYDFDGDGRTDVVYRSGNDIRVLRNGATQDQAIVVSAGTAGWGQHFETHLGDFNGDGITDVASKIDTTKISVRYSSFEAPSGAASVSNHLSGQNSAQPDAIRRIVSGLRERGGGAIVEITYRTMAQAMNGHTSVDPLAVIPEGNVVVGAPIWLVHEVHSSHGAGAAEALRGTQYQYFNLHMNSEGRGVMGFEAESVRDLHTGDYEITQYEVKWPHNGMIRRKDTYLSNGTRIGRLEQTFEKKELNSSATVMPYIDESVETEYDDFGGALRWVTTNYSEPTVYGDYPSITVTTAGADGAWSTKVTDNTYLTADLTHWVLGRLSEVQVTHTSGGAHAFEPIGNGTIIRKSSFTYLPGGGQHGGMLKTETIEPGAAQTETVTTSYSYDQWGHKKEVTTRGHSNFEWLPELERKTSTTTQVSGDQLTITTTQATRYPDVHASQLNLVSTQVLSLRHGGAVFAKDPNGLETTTDFDPFGRKTRAHTLGAQTDVWVNVSYDSVENDPIEVQKITTTTSAGGLSETWLDLEGREVRKATRGLNGKKIFESTRFDVQGRVIEATRPHFDYVGPHVVRTHYDDRGRIREIDAPGSNGARAVTNYAYAGFLTTITDPMSRNRTELRNALGQTVRVTEGNQLAATNYYFDATGNLTKTVDALGQTTLMYYNTQGKKKAMKDPHMGHWQYFYNSFGDLEKQFDAKGKWNWVFHDAIGRKVQQIRTGDAKWAMWFYDSRAKGEISRILWEGKYDEQRFYDSDARLTSVSRHILNEGQFETFSTAFAYDDQNRVTRETRPGGFQVDHVYNAFGYEVALQSPAQATDGMDVEDESAINARIDEILGQLPTYESAVTALATEQNDLKNAANAWEIEAQSIRNQAKSSADPDLIAYYELAQDRANDYRAQIEALEAQRVEYVEDAAKLQDYADYYITLLSDPYLQAQHWHTLLTQRASEVQERADAMTLHASNLDYMIANYYQPNQAYFDADVQGYEQQIFGGVQQQIDQLHQDAADARAQAESMQVGLSAATAERDRLTGQLEMLQSNLNESDTIVWWRANEVDAEGRIAQELLGNGLITRRTYEAATGQLHEIKTGGALFAGTGPNDASIQDVGYEYDHVNSVRMRWDHNIELDAAFDYDALDRLISADFSHPNPNMNMTFGMSWTYDAAGNLEQRVSRQSTMAYTYAQENVSGLGSRKRLSNISGFGGVGDLVFDPNGNTLQTGNRSVTWNNANQPVHLTNGSNTVEYTYGPDGQRLTKLDNTWDWDWKTVYVGGEYERSRVNGTHMGNFTEHRYPLVAGGRVIGTRLRLEWHSSGANTYRAEYYHQDALGNVEVITDSIGRINKRWFYEPFGTRYDVTAVGLDNPDLVRDVKFFTFQQRGFTGHEHMDLLAFVHMNGRVYDSLTHRFLSADPNIQSPYDTQNHNRYSYVKNNPLKYSDPSGYFFKKLFKSIGNFVKKFWRPILAIAITIVSLGSASAAAFGLLFGSAGGFASAVVGGFAAGLVASGGDLRAGLVGAVTAGAFYGVGSGFGKVTSFGERVAKIATHGAVGGLASTAQGGKFSHGFLSSAFTQAFAPGIDKIQAGGRAARVAVASLVGGTASAIGGGKFANGAVTGAFSRAFNDDHPDHNKPPEGCAGTCVRIERNGRIMWVPQAYAADAIMTMDSGMDSIHDYKNWSPREIADTASTVATATGIGGGAGLLFKGGAWATRALSLSLVSEASSVALAPSAQGSAWLGVGIMNDALFLAAPQVRGAMTIMENTAQWAGQSTSTCRIPERC